MSVNSEASPLHQQGIRYHSSRCIDRCQSMLLSVADPVVMCVVVDVENHSVNEEVAAMMV